MERHLLCLFFAPPSALRQRDKPALPPLAGKSFGVTRNPLKSLGGLGSLLILLGGSRLPVNAQFPSDKQMGGYTTVFGLEKGQQTTTYEVREVAVTVGTSQGANVLWPGETATFTFRFTNKTARPLQTTGRLDVIHYGTHVPLGQAHGANVFKIADLPPTPFSINLPPRGTAEITVRPTIPETFGGYALIADLGEYGREFAATLVRTLAADPGPVQFPMEALDFPRAYEMSEALPILFERLGIKGCRLEAGNYPTTLQDFERWGQEFAQHLAWAQKHQIAILLTLGANSAPKPLGRPRPWLSPENVMLNTKADHVWLPEYDSHFQQWVRLVAGRYGWPKGPVNAMELWNEPWEGISISGWGADMPRFRDLYRRMALGVEEARQSEGVQVLLGGASSCTNTRDKLFSDGSDTFLKWLDFVSIHYQPLAADAALEKKWLARKSPNGPVRMWDTEMWIADSGDRIAAVIASTRAQGLSRTSVIFHRLVYTSEVLSKNPRIGICQAWAPAVALAACQKFLGQRPFREILFKNGLPWVFVFDGAPTPLPPSKIQNPKSKILNTDDGTFVLVGDLGAVYERSRVLFRSVTGLQNLPRVAEAQKNLEALPPDTPTEKRKVYEDALAAAQVLQDASLTIPDGAGQFLLYDFNGNPIPAQNGNLTVPLNGVAFFLRTNGSPGSFARLRQALLNARIEGYVPLCIQAHDLTAPIGQHPTLRLRLTNILNRPLQGELRVSLGKLRLAWEKEREPFAKTRLTFAPHETKWVNFRVLDGEPQPDNAYPLTVAFDAGRDGQARHQERMHVNSIARRTIRVDGNLEDWNGILPQSASAGLGASLSERAYLSFLKFDTQVSGGLATGYLAYDDRYFYFAAQIADSTPYAGNVRFETRDDDAYYYPEKVVREERDPRTQQVTKREELTWPAGVRRFSYRKNPDLPSGNGTDNVQIAFNVLPEEQKPWLPYPPGTMPRFMTYADTDYEFAFHAVAEAYGGGTEIWRLLAPGMPRKHFYPRQPKAPKDGGPVKDGQLAMRREGNRRFVEAALPWSELPEVKKCWEAGKTIKFTFRINDNDGPAYELATGRSVSREGNVTFHNDWTRHWANELEFGFEKKTRISRK